MEHQGLQGLMEWQANKVLKARKASEASQALGSKGHLALQEDSLMRTAELLLTS